MRSADSSAVFSPALTARFDTFRRPQIGLSCQKTNAEDKFALLSRLQSRTHRRKEEWRRNCSKTCLLMEATWAGCVKQFLTEAEQNRDEEKFHWNERAFREASLVQHMSSGNRSYKQFHENLLLALITFHMGGLQCHREKLNLETMARKFQFFTRMWENVSILRVPPGRWRRIKSIWMKVFLPYAMVGARVNKWKPRFAPPKLHNSLLFMTAAGLLRDLKQFSHRPVTTPSWVRLNN